jgi:hypothetical protein
MDQFLLTPPIESMLNSAERGQIENVSAGEVNDIEMRPSIFHPRHESIPDIRGLRLSTELTAEFRQLTQQAPFASLLC